MNQAYTRPDTEAFLTYLNALPGPRAHELPPTEARAALRAMGGVADVPVGELAVIRDFSFDGPAGPINVRLFDARESRAPGPVMVFFHGGGWVMGDLDTHAPFCAEAARALDLPVISVDYRLAPEHGWPAAPDDCEAAARWIASGPEAIGRGVTGLILAGDSAGGNLTIVTAMALRDAPAAAPVIAQFPIYPAVDFSRAFESEKLFGDGYLLSDESIRWFGEQYAPDPQNVRASPLRGNLAEMPPALVLTAGLDPLRDQGRAYAGALVAAGVPVIFREAKGNIHAFINLARGIPSSVGDIAGALSALKQLINEAEAGRTMMQAVTE